MYKEDIIRALDPVAFSRHIGIEPVPWQAEVLRYEGKRMLLNCSRQSGKSTTTAMKALHRGVYTPGTVPDTRYARSLYFNPRPREEGDCRIFCDHVNPLISIHALVKRATCAPS